MRIIGRSCLNVILSSMELKQENECSLSGEIIILSLLGGYLMLYLLKPP